MAWNKLNKPLCLNLVSAIILVLGLCTAVVIYQRAGQDTSNVLGYESGGGTVYPINPEDSKQYQRGLELYGGKANVLADEFRRWFDSLWHGKSLAVIVAGATIIISFAFYHAANSAKLHAPTQTHDERHDNGPAAS